MMSGGCRSCSLGKGERAEREQKSVGDRGKRGENENLWRP